MRWILALMLCLLPLAHARADGPDDQFVELYTLIQQGDSLNQSGQTTAAMDKYQRAQNGLKTLQGGYPNWNKDVVQFRLDYVTEKLNSVPKEAPAPVPAPQPVLSPAELARQSAAQQEQIATLSRENASLERKLKEALSVQPAAVDPQELAKAEARVNALQKEKDLLTVSLEQEKEARAKAEKSSKSKKGPSDSEIAALHAKALAADEAVAERDALRRKLSDANKEISVLQALHNESPNATVNNDAELARLKDANTEAEKKLAEAQKTLSELKAMHVETPKTDSHEAELARLKESNSSLQKKLSESEMAYEALKARPVEKPKSNEAELVRLKEANADTEKKLAETKQDLDKLKSTRREDIRHAEEAKTKEFNSERDELKKKLANTTKELADSEARHDGNVSSGRNDATQLKKLSLERETLAMKLKASEADVAALKASVAATPKGRPESSGDLTLKNAQLQARLAVYEANPVPYTAEESAALKKLIVTATATPPAPARSGSKQVHSMKDLPAGAGSLMAEAQRAFQAREFDKAEKKYREVLSQDDKNVYVLAHLANAQFAAGEIEDCEKTVREVIALDPNDPAGLYLMGNLRMRQGKLDEALDALSRSAQINPTNSVTQNSLGTVLSQKGQRKAAETALRKALMTDPDYADAHHNLAIVYATENPPAMELARLHYKKAMDLGHPRDSDLEKLMEDKK